MHNKCNPLPVPGLTVMACSNFKFQLIGLRTVHDMELKQYNTFLMQLPRYTQPTTTTRRTTTTARIQRNPSCLDDNTAYYGNNLKFENNYSSSEDCRRRCDRYPGCNFWSFMKSNGRCFIKSSKVLKFTYFAFM